MTEIRQNKLIHSFDIMVTTYCGTYCIKYVLCFGSIITTYKITVHIFI